MNNHPDKTENFVNAESYYPKSITLGKGTNARSLFEQNQPQQQDTSQNENSQSSWQNNNSSFMQSGYSNFNQQYQQNQFSQQNQGRNPLQSLFSNLFSSNNPLLSQFLSGNPLLSMLFSGKQNTNQNELMTNLLGSLMQKQDSKEKEEKVIDLKNSVEEF